jgi:hypothetical protein
MVRMLLEELCAGMESARMRIAERRAFIAVVSLLLGQAGMTQSAAPDRALSPSEFMRAVIANELKPTPDADHWMYDVEKEQDGQKQSKEVVQTREGSLERLIATDGRVLSSARQQEEAIRIESLLKNTQERQRLEEVRKKDAKECEAFLRMIPGAFLFMYQGQEGPFVKLSFKPNPSFQPSSRAAHVLHAMEGEILVQAKEQRLAAINGRLVEEVRFGGGLLGHLEKGGTFSVRRAALGPTQWMLVAMDVNMKGKALFFKTIAVQQKEYRRNFRKLPDDLTLTDAAHILTNRVTLAANQ